MKTIQKFIDEQLTLYDEITKYKDGDYNSARYLRSCRLNYPKVLRALKVSMRALPYLRGCECYTDDCLGRCFNCLSNNAVREIEKELGIEGEK